MRVIIASMIFMFLSVDSACAFKCWQMPGVQGYEKAERVFLAYVTQTRLDEKLWADLNKGYPAEDDDTESVKAIFADYKIIEEFKGDAEYKPFLIDLLGIGTGYLGVTPGKYYFIMLGPLREGKPSDIRAVNICNTPLQHYRLNAEPFQKELNVYRAVRDSNK